MFMLNISVLNLNTTLLHHHETNVRFYRYIKFNASLTEVAECVILINMWSMRI